MKVHSSDFKNQIKEFGRELDNKITYTLNNEEIVLGNEDLNAITPHYEGDILKSVMKQLDIDTNVEIPIGTEVNYQFGVLVNGSYEYIDFGNYIVYSSEKQEDTLSWKLVCYDKMLYSMKNYEQPVSRNMFDISQVQPGYINTTGGIAPYIPNNEGYVRYIPCEPNTTYTFDIVETPSSFAQWLGIAEYSDESESTFLRNSVRAMANVPYTFTTGANAHYLCVSGRNILNATKVQLEKNSSFTTYIPYFNEYPITIKNYLTILADNIGLKLKDTNFVNQDKEIESELYLSREEDEEGNITYSSLDYTYRDVLDEIAGVTASTICINKDDELEVRYIATAIGKNLFDKTNEITDRKTYTSTGGITGLGNCFVQESYIPVESSTAYTLSTTNDYSNETDYRLVICEYQEDKTFIQRNIGTKGGGITTKYTITTTANTKYVRLCATTITIDELQFEKGSQATDYEPYGDTIDEEYLKDVNVKFGEKYGPVNSVVLSRSAESDNIYRKDDESIELNGLTEIKITENQILNSNNRDDFIDGIYNELHGLEYYINDYSSTGIGYYDLCDRYNVTIDQNTYSCVMFNDEFLVTQGLEENVHTDNIENSETDYTKADTTDRKIKQAYIIVDKANQEINSFVGEVQDTLNEQGERISELGTRVTQTENEWRTSISSVQNQIDNGVGLVKTTSVTIDNNGLNVSTDNSKIATVMTNEAFKIVPKGSDEPLAYFGYDSESASTVARMDNLTITNYLTMGNHRVEKFTRDGEDRTGFFYIGG